MSSLFKILYLTLILFFINFASFTSIVVNLSDPISIPSFTNFNYNSDFIKNLHQKKITPAEYITDPLIMYSSLWGCMAITLPLWEFPSAQFIQAQKFDPFDKTSWINWGFINRMKMEPFATGRIDPITKPIKINGVDANTVKNDFFAKNLIEPFFFTELALYMRSKNYHPALMIGEIITLSLMYEFTIRPFFLNSSFEQLLKNPAVGLIAGIFIDELSTFLLTTPYIGLHILAYILNPFNALPTSRVHSLLLFNAFQKEAAIETVIKL